MRSPPDVEPAQSMPAVLHDQPALQWCLGGGVQPVVDKLIEEVPVALTFNGVSYATMLVTPNDLEDFARGFALTEGIVPTLQQIYDVEPEVTPQGIVLHVEIASSCMQALRQRRRALAGRTGCGLCGVESLEFVQRTIMPRKPFSQSVLIDPEAILRAQAAMHQVQPLFHDSGASHAAALATLSGDIVAVREDVGRHNALDKLIGATAATAEPGVVLVTSRASFEMVQKTRVAGHVALAAVSAPTAMAQRLAHEHDLLLMGFVRNQRLTVYAGQHWLAASVLGPL